LEQLQDVCNELKDENEIAIIEKYGSKAKFYTTAIIRKTMVVESLIIHQDSYVKLALLVLNKFRRSCCGIVTSPSFSALF